VVDKVETFRDRPQLDRTPGVDGFGDILEMQDAPQMSQGEGKGILCCCISLPCSPFGMNREGPQDPPG